MNNTKSKNGRTKTVKSAPKRAFMPTMTKGMTKATSTTVKNNLNPLCFIRYCHSYVEDFSVAILHLTFKSR